MGTLPGRPNMTHHKMVDDSVFVPVIKVNRGCAEWTDIEEGARVVQARAPKVHLKRGPGEELPSALRADKGRALAVDAGVGGRAAGRRGKPLATGTAVVLPKCWRAGERACRRLYVLLQLLLVGKYLHYYYDL